MKPAPIYTLNGSGTEIPNLNVFGGYDSFIINGTAIAKGNYNITYSGTPIQGIYFDIFYEGSLNITTNSTSFNILGTPLTQTQLQTRWQASVYYNGSTWVVNISPNFQQAVLGTQNFPINSVPAGALVTNSVNTNNIINQSVTNVKLNPGPSASLKITNPSGGVTDLVINQGQTIINNGGTLRSGSPLSGTYETINFTTEFSTTSGSGCSSNIFLPYACTILYISCSVLESSSGSGFGGLINIIDGTNSVNILPIGIPTSAAISSYYLTTNVNYTYTPTNTTSYISVQSINTYTGGKFAISMVVIRT